jgi:TetR/AcrR family transcriptional regulator, transcriptional repressor for nem operon
MWRRRPKQVIEVEETRMAEPGTHKERTRARILDEAAKALREHGHEGVGVAALMKRAGLTHGGFYAHFKNRDDLVAAAIGRMFADSKAMVERHLAAEDPRKGLASLIDYYLSEQHRDRIDRGCPIAALNSESVRLPEAAHHEYQEGVSRFRASIADALTQIGRTKPDELASSAVAEMVGALALARTMPPEDSKDLLSRSRQQLKLRLGLSPAH